MSAVFKCDRCEAIQVPDVGPGFKDARGYFRSIECEEGKVKAFEYDLCEECCGMLVGWILDPTDALPSLRESRETAQ